MLVILFVVALRGPQLPESLRGIDKLTFIESGIPSAIGVISFAFVCHHNSLLIYGSLARPTLDRFANLTHFSTGFSVVASLAMALCGFLVFAEKTQGVSFSILSIYVCKLMRSFPEHSEQFPS